MFERSSLPNILEAGAVYEARNLKPISPWSIVLVTRLTLLALGGLIVLSAAGCKSGGSTEVGAPPAPAAGPRRIATLPENPCDLLTRGDVSVATGLRVRRARKVPDIDEIVAAGKAGRPAHTSTICSYDTGGELVAITITVPPLENRNAAAYNSEREAYFRQYPGSAKPITGIGNDAWLAGGTTLHVLAGPNAPFTVATRIAQPNSPDVVAKVARAVVERLSRQR